jgi:1-acyl-sn-glycerol-3-phosphate acyltransferase
MPYLRAFGVFSTLIFFFVVGAPLQWLILKLSLPGRHILPLLFNRVLLGFLRIRVQVQHETPATEAAKLPQLLVSNHVSWTDIPALGTLHSISFLAKREVGTWPVIASYREQFLSTA